MPLRRLGRAALLAWGTTVSSLSCGTSDEAPQGPPLMVDAPPAATLTPIAPPPEPIVDVSEPAGQPAESETAAQEHDAPTRTTPRRRRRSRPPADMYVPLYGSPF